MLCAAPLLYCCAIAIDALFYWKIRPHGSIVVILAGFAHLKAWGIATIHSISARTLEAEAATTNTARPAGEREAAAIDAEEECG